MARRLILLTFACLAIVRINSQDLVSPCPEFFTYDTSVNEQDIWHGNVTILSNETLDGVWLRLLFNNAPLHVEFQNQFGEIRTHDSVNYIIKNVDYELKANTSLMLRFHVQYDTSKPVPLLIGIRLNAKTICQNEKIDEPSDPAINKTMDGTITVSKGCLLQDDGQFDEALNSTNDNCGRRSLMKPESLLLDNDSDEGKWPWIVALYKSVFGLSIYTCGGSLISHNFIVTVAYCLINTLNGDHFSPNTILAYLGTTSIKELSDGLQIATISQIIVHPEYKQKNNDNNIAILKTRRPVEYTYFVKPVCLWDGDNLADKIGNVIAWRYDSRGRILETIKEFKMAIVDNKECISSSPEYLGKYIHMTSFCAGVQNDSSPYNGSPGSGLVVKQNNVNGDELWYLRGLVSHCVSTGNSQCDPKHYVIFVDFAKLIPWIKEEMKNI